MDGYNEKSITASLKKIISDKVLVQNLREKGLAQAQKFSWTNAAESLKTLIEEKIHLPKNPLYV